MHIGRLFPCKPSTEGQLVNTECLFESFETPRNGISLEEISWGRQTNTQGCPQRLKTFRGASDTHVGVACVIGLA